MPVPAIARPLGVRADLLLTPEQLEMLQALEGFDLWFVEERLGRKGRVAPERIAGAVLEFRRYMALIGLGYHGLAMLSPEVDEVWHGLILFTREYADFCQAAFGVFIHHVPRTSRTRGDDGSVDGFVAAYQEVFGDPPAEWYAVRQGRAGDEPSGCGTEDCQDG